MTDTTVGAGIEAVEAHLPECPVIEPALAPAPVPNIFEQLPEGFDVIGLVDAVKQGMRHEMEAAVADIERRLGQAREIEKAIATGVPRETRHTEDLDVGFAMIDGYTLTSNSPAAGSIAWANLFVILLGVTYTIAPGNTALKYAWFVKPATYTEGTAVTLQTSNTLPTLANGDAMIWINNGGVPISVLESSITYAVGPGAIGNAQLDAATQTFLNGLQAADIALQARVDGVISSYSQATAPWPNGSPSDPPGPETGGGDINMGDMWYDTDDGGAFRWSGASGTPANTWVRVADTDNSALNTRINTKSSTYLATNAAGPQLVAPNTAFAVGDTWLVTDLGNLLRRWNGTAWVDVLIGDAAIASGISGAKIGSGINATNITTGTVNGTLVGTGINGTNVTTGTVGGARIGTGVSPSVLTGSGTAPLTAIPQLTPAKLNTPFHMLL